MSKFSGAGSLLVLSLAAACGGCQRQNQWELVPVEGTVTQAGVPLPGVKVVFWTDTAAGTQGPPTSGYTDANGRYELRTHSGGRGAAAGHYRVCIVAPAARDRSLVELSSAAKRSISSTEPNDKPSLENVVRVPRKFSRFDQTPLRADVKPGSERPFDFDVPVAPPRQKIYKPAE